MRAPDAVGPSAAAGIVWPVIPARELAAELALRWGASHVTARRLRPGPIAGDAALLLALQAQFEHSEKLDRAQVECLQLRQIEQLLAHAYAHVPFHRPRLHASGYRPDRPLTWQDFVRIPIMRRKDVQAAGTTLTAQALPGGHGAVQPDSTSGSTAEPIRFAATDVVRLMWHALTLREHLWHGRDFGARLAAIRSVIAVGDQPTWGLPVDIVFETGPAFGLRVSSPVSEQAAWLEARDPDYLISYPSNLLALAREFIGRGRRLSRLRAVRSFGERLPESLRDACREAWGVPLIDVYSAQETGYLALQCPLHDHYHVQAESVLVEVLDDRGKPCPPGRIGRVVVTSLHNFVTPFIRYDLGDYAEAGEGCDCGRGLPILARILGRARNMAVLANGDRFWPRIRPGEWFGVVPVQAFRLVQTGIHSMRLEVTTPHPMTAEQARALCDNVCLRLGHPFEVVVQRVASIARGPADKLEDFVCEVGA